MRVGIFTECYEPVVNGVVHSICNTKRGLEELGHEVFIFTPDYQERNVLGHDIIPCKSRLLLGGSGYHFVFDFEEEIKKMAAKMDVFHTHHPFTMARHVIKLAKEYSKPLLFTHHTQYQQYAHLALIFKHQAEEILTSYLRKFCDQCDTVIAPSFSIKKVIESYGTQTPIHVVLNSIDLDYFKKKNLKKPEIFSKLKPDYKKLILVTRIEKEKNIEFLIKVFKTIFLTHAPVYLIIVGNGTALDYFKNLVKELEIEEKVILTGAAPYEEVSCYYRHADFFVTASKTEVLPLGLIEAQASGLPIVAIDAIGTRDIVEDDKTGYLTKDNLTNFAAKVIRLTNNPQKIKTMSKNALIASKKYSIKACAQEMLKTYEEAIKLHGLKQGA